MTFVLVTWSIAFVLVRQGLDLALAAVAAAAAPALAGGVWTATRGATPPVVRERDPDETLGEEAALAPAAHPYRARIRRAALSAAPKVSGTAVVLIVLAALGFCALSAPAMLHLPKWIELEIAVAAWWAVLSGVLAVLLYRGYRLRDDFAFRAPWESRTPKAAPRGGTSSGWKDFGLSGCDGCSVDGEGFVVILIILVALIGAIVLVELVVPAAFLLTYAVMMKALKTVAHDRHGCQGSVAKSIGWGALWSLIFAAPLAVAAQLVQLVLPRV